MARGATLRIEGYTELMRALKHADREQRLEVRHTLRDVGAIVQRDAAQRFTPINSKSAAGYKVRVRQRGVAVEQSIRKTTGTHPEWGSLQMRKALIPALYANEDDTARAMDAAMDKVARDFDRVAL
jgi:hypothetical protein